MAILWGNRDKQGIAFMQCLTQLGWLVLAFYLKLPPIFYLFFILGGMLFIQQQQRIQHREAKACFQAFLSNHWYGFCLWLGLFFH